MLYMSNWSNLVSVSSEIKLHPFADYKACQ